MNSTDTTTAATGTAAGTGRLAVGARAPGLTEAVTMTGAAPPVLGRSGRSVVLKFYRFANCPLCNLHLHSWVVRAAEVKAAGLVPVAVFHSPVRALREQLQQGAAVPFDVIADPDKRLFRAYGVEESLAGMLHARVAADNMRALRAGYRSMLPFGHEGGIRGHPADFLVDPDGIVRLAHYGADYADTLDVDTVLNAARDLLPAPPPGPAPRPAGRT
ncbi:peroxiredoxin-like family protein [Streptomyces sp. NPDC051921]|uniref:peroxiredoxin-like family protein n=1 Tax=Streptomyces sp. NPDC051921 TaxID=3155806 RepID=UPI003420F0E0